LSKGSSIQTTNYYLSHLKSFCRWLVKDRRMSENPFAHLEAGNVEVDRRHDRRELTADELTRLLETAKASPRTFRGLTGRDRFVLYATACGTGFRAGALASLTPGHFDLESPRPTVTLAARKNKSRKPRVQPLPADLAELLSVYLVGRPTDVTLWGGDWPRKGEGAEMLRADLADASIPYAVDGPDGPLFADFHALRHSYITALGRSGVDLRTAQELAGHSTPVLTARYMHVRLHDLVGSVDKLPSILPPGPMLPAAAQATGMDDAICSGFARPAAPSVHLVAAPGTEQGGVEKRRETAQLLEKAGVGTLCHHLASAVVEEAPPGFEPGMADLQSAALAPQSLVLSTLQAPVPRSVAPQLPAGSTRVAEALSHLPDAIRRAVLALIGAVGDSA
ncbi:MAG TPA: site-specific integrase, partial [Gemmataceae bacterium]|nr:site-specific integrase [Gemmataceae bacterium]